MEKTIKDLSKDPLFLVALELNDVDLANFCKSNKKFNEQICKKDDIWNYKLSRLDKKYSEDIQELKKEVKTPRELYQLIKSLIVAKEIFKVNWSLNELYNKKIIWINKEIKKIPNLSLFKNLRELDLSWNKIEKIPETLPNSLSELNLRHNKIEKIPETLPNSLQELYLGYNKIIKIPMTLPKSLQKLSLDDNQIKEIPKTLPNSLQELYLNSNQIEKIPETLPNSLQKLSLGNNQIKEIPEKYRGKRIIMI
jgi:Leucine-rich repeat (LRR) protein